MKIWRFSAIMLITIKNALRKKNVYICMKCLIAANMVFLVKENCFCTGTSPLRPLIMMMMTMWSWKGYWKWWNTRGWVYESRTFENPSQSDHSDDSDDETKCDLCDFNTDVKANLTKHKENIHNWCCLCDNMFESRMKMKNHKYVVHSVKYYTTYNWRLIGIKQGPG